MKKIINGSRYDTSTAKYLGGTSYSHPGDFDYWSEELYRTKSGKYFLYGEGGPNSRYAVSESANSWSGGEKILPMVEAEAEKWAEENLTGEEVEAAFSIPAEDATAVTAYLPESILAALDARKVKDGCSRTDVIINALRSTENRQSPWLIECRIANAIRHFESLYSKTEEKQYLYIRNGLEMALNILNGSEDGFLPEKELDEVGAPTEEEE